MPLMVLLDPQPSEKKKVLTNVKCVHMIFQNIFQINDRNSFSYNMIPQVCLKMTKFNVGAFKFDYLSLYFEYFY